MHRNTMLVLAAGLAGAFSTAVAGHLFLTPAVASPSEVSITDARTGTVDVLQLLERMLDMESYATERDNETRVWNEQVTSIAQERDSYLQALQRMDPEQAETPAAQSLYAQYQSAQQRFEQARQQAGMAIDSLAAGQLTRAYQAVHTAVQKIAAEQGYDRVFSTRMTVDAIDASNTNVVVQEVLLRPLLFDATSDDLTPLIATELGIPEMADPTVEEPVPGADAQPPADATTPPEGGG